MLFNPDWKPTETETTKPPDERWREILLEAADLIEKKGWIRCGLQSLSGFYAIGALQKVAFGTTYSSSWEAVPKDKKEDSNTAPYLFACQKLAHATKTNTIYGWNDADDMTAERIISKMRKVAAK